MENLEDKLRKETAELKAAYLVQTRNWAKNHFEAMKAKLNWSKEQWAKHLDIETEVYYEGTASEHVDFKRGFHSTRKARVYHSEYSAALNVTYKGLNAYVESKEKDAVMHYDNSIKKLGSRLEGKGVSTDFEMVHQRLGVNFEIIIKHPDGKFTKAWTIIAEGEIQRPHYRFLVK